MYRDTSIWNVLTPGSVRASGKCTVLAVSTDDYVGINQSSSLTLYLAINE